MTHASQRKKRHHRIRAKVQGTSLRPRVSVFRSLRRLMVQLIDDEKGVTLVSLQSPLESKKTKVEQAEITGREIAAAAQKKGITKVVFDRGGYNYHGRIKALADSMRQGGLQF